MLNKIKDKTYFEIRISRTDNGGSLRNILVLPTSLYNKLKEQNGLDFDYSGLDLVTELETNINRVKVNLIIEEIKDIYVEDIGVSTKVIVFNSADEVVFNNNLMYFVRYKTYLDEYLDKPLVEELQKLYNLTKLEQEYIQSLVNGSYKEDTALYLTGIEEKEMNEKQQKGVALSNKSQIIKWMSAKGGLVINRHLIKDIEKVYDYYIKEKD